jgi:hypothetical protein
MLVVVADFRLGPILFPLKEMNRRKSFFLVFIKLAFPTNVTLLLISYWLSFASLLTVTRRMSVLYLLSSSCLKMKGKVGIVVGDVAESGYGY